MTTPSITYRCGAWLVDTQHGKVGQLMDSDHRVARLRSPDGSEEWDAEPTSLRLAAKNELVQARKGSR